MQQRRRGGVVVEITITTSITLVCATEPVSLAYFNYSLVSNSVVQVSLCYYYNNKKRLTNGQTWCALLIQNSFKQKQFYTSQLLF